MTVEHESCVTRSRASLEELWIRQRELAGSINSAVIHDLNNLLASVETNAYLLQGEVSEAGRSALEGLESVVRDGGEICTGLISLGVHALRAEPPLRLDDALNLLPPLVQRLGRPHSLQVPELGKGLEPALVSSLVVRQGLLTLAVLGIELLPAHGALVVRATRDAQSQRIQVSLRLDCEQPLDFSSNGASALSGLGLGQQVRWLARRSGGDLLIERPPGGRLRFDLLMLEEQPAKVSRPRGEA